MPVLACVSPTEPPLWPIRMDFGMHRPRSLKNADDLGRATSIPKPDNSHHRTARLRAINAVIARGAIMWRGVTAVPVIGGQRLSNSGQPPAIVQVRCPQSNSSNNAGLALIAHRS